MEVVWACWWACRWACMGGYSSGPENVVQSHHEQENLILNVPGFILLATMQPDMWQANPRKSDQYMGRVGL